MKVRREGGSGWKSFDVVLTVESEEEAKALYAIFNYYPNTKLLDDKFGESIRRVIGFKYADLGPSSLIAKGVCYGVFYRSKREA